MGRFVKLQPDFKSSAEMTGLKNGALRIRASGFAAITQPGLQSVSFCQAWEKTGKNNRSASICRSAPP